MKRFLLLFAFVPLLSFAAKPAAPKLINTLDELKVLAEQAPVAAIDLVLPSGEREIEKALWDQFANKLAEKQFAGVSAKDWTAKWDLLAAALIEKAQKQQLDGASLRASLGALNRGYNEQTKPVSPTPLDTSWVSPKGEEAPARAAAKPEPEAPSPSSAPKPTPEPADQFLDATIPVGAYFAHHAGGTCWIIVCKWEIPAPELPLGHIRIWAVDCATYKVIGFTGCD
jgi:hypothetical protein